MPAELTGHYQRDLNRVRNDETRTESLDQIFKLRNRIEKTDISKQEIVAEIDRVFKELEGKLFF